MKVIQTEHLVKQYVLGKHVVNALDGVNLEVEHGEFVGIMGPSGSGKSTLLHLLGGLDGPTSGNILLDGQNLSHLTDLQITYIRRRNVGFVFQFFNLLPTLSAEENILLPLIIDGKNRKEYEGRLSEILKRVGLEDRRHHRPDQLSGGE
ncbi:MAG: ATP-binding cassette domain-containing protein, partial [Erysipelotrichales bacterium]